MADDIFVKKKKKKKGEVDEDSDHPVHEEYTKEEPVKEG
jgi:hypothetical protein